MIAPDTRPARIADYAILCAITAIAAGLRLYRIDAPLWYDEVLTLLDFVRPPLEQIVTTYTSLNNHVLYSVQAHLSVALFGESAAALRYPAVAAGVAAVPLLWAFARQIGMPVLWAHILAALLALSYHHIWFSQNARGYTGLFLLCLAATMLFIRGARGPGVWPWIAFTVVAALAVYTHLSAAFYFVALGLIYFTVFLWSCVDRVEGAFGTLAPLAWFFGAAALSVALHAPMLGQMVQTFTAVGPEAAPEAVAEWTSPFWTVLEMLRSFPGPMGIKLALLPVVLVLVWCGIWNVFRREPIVAAAFAVHVGLTLAILLGLGFRIWPRYFFFDIAFLLMFLVAGTFVLGRLVQAGLGPLLGWRPARQDLLGLIGCGLGIAASAGLASRNYVAPKQDFAGAVAYVEARLAPGDIAASFGLSATPVSRYFAPDWTMVETAAALEALRSRPGTTWVVFGFKAHSEGRHPDIMAALGNGFEEVADLPGTMGDGWVHIWRER